MNFIEAIELLKENKKVRRKGWSGTYFIHIYYDQLVFYLNENNPAEKFTFEAEDLYAEDWEEYLEIKPNHEISENERKAFEEGFKIGFDSVADLYEKGIKELESKRAYWSKRFKELEEKR